MIFVFFFTDNIFGSIFLHTKCTFSPKYVQFFQKYSKHFCILYQISPHDIILLHHTCLWRLRQISCSSYSQLSRNRMRWPSPMQLWLSALKLQSHHCHSHGNRIVFFLIEIMTSLFLLWWWTLSLLKRLVIIIILSRALLESPLHFKGLLIIFWIF